MFIYNDHEGEDDDDDDDEESEILRVNTIIIIFMINLMSPPFLLVLVLLNVVNGADGYEFYYDDVDFLLKKKNKFILFSLFYSH